MSPIIPANDEARARVVPLHRITGEQIVERDAQQLQAYLERGKGDPAAIEQLAEQLEIAAIRNAEVALSQQGDPLAFIRIAGRQATSAQILRASLVGGR